MKSMRPSAEEIARLRDCALGKEKADLLLLEGTVVDVSTGELLPRCSVAVKGERIACVGTEATTLAAPQTRVINRDRKVAALVVE